MPTLTHPQTVSLITLMRASFNTSDIEAACHAINVEREDFPREFSAFVLELVQYCERHDKTPELVRALNQLNPSLDLQAWGGNPPKPTVQGVLSMVLDAGFTRNDLMILAFDVMRPVHQDGQYRNRSELIQAIVDHALNHGLVYDVWAWVTANNSYQAGKYAAEMQTALADYVPPSPKAIKVSRKASYEDLLDVVTFYANGNWDGGELARKVLGW